MFFNINKEKQDTPPSAWSRWGRKMATGLAVVGFSVLAMMPSTVSASDSYFLSFTFNAESRTIVPNVSLSEIGRSVNRHAEVANGAHYLWGTEGDLLFLTNDNHMDGESVAIDIPTDVSDIPDFFVSSRPSDDYEYTIPFSFPGRHVGTIPGARLFNDGDTARDATTADQAQAQRVGQQLTTSFNRIFGDAHMAAGGGTTAKELSETAAKLANAGVNGGSVTFGEGSQAVTFTFNTYIEGSERTGTSLNIPIAYYRGVTITGGEGSSRRETVLNLPVKVPKGYAPGQQMYDRIENTEYHEAGHHLVDAHYISWQHMVMQAMNNAHNGIFLSDVQELNPPSALEGYVVGMLSGITGQIRGFLGLEPIPDLVFNNGMHGDGSVYGTMPMAMGQVADFVFFLMLVLAGFILLGSFVSLLIKSNLSVVNPQMRVDLKDGLMTIFGAFFILIIFQPIWGSLMRLNVNLVDFFYGLSTNIDNMGSMLITNSGNLAGIILSIAFLVVEIWFNFYYIVRALTIMVLYMFAPLMIISIAYGGKYRMIFSNWSKELLGGLFIQSIHAAILGAITAGLDQGMAQSLLWQYVILISIIPLSNLFRKNILNLGGDSIGQTAGRAEKATMMAGAIGGGLALKGASTVGSAAIGGMAAGGLSKVGLPKPRGNESPGGGGGGGSSVGGQGGSSGSGGSPGKSALRDEPADHNANKITTAQGKENAKIANDARNGKPVMSEQARDRADRKAYNKEHRAEHLSSMAQKGAQWAQSDKLAGGKTLGAGLSNVAGAVMTAGVVAGDMATETDSQSAIMAGAKILKGGKGGKGGKRDGAHSGNSYGEAGASASASPDYSSPASIMAEQPPVHQLESLAKNEQSGDQGALVSHRTNDGQTMVTYSKEQMKKKLGVENIETVPPSREHPSGQTRMEYSAENLTEENREALEMGASFTEKIQSGNIDSITNEEWGHYGRMGRNSRVSNVVKDGDKYVVDIDNEQAGWSGTAVDKDYFMVKADATANKKVPDFKQNSADTAHFREWHRSTKDLMEEAQ